MKQWYEALFENYAHKYDNECFVQGTVGECDFIEAEINHDKSLKIIDIGCGTGRHAIELTKRGYKVIGIDLSDSQLKRAREKAKEHGVQVDFQKHDARNIPFKGEFDLAIMLCEGGFPLMETDEMNFEILKNAAKALKEKGKLIFTTLNGLFRLYYTMEHLHIEHGDSDNAVYKNSIFDPMTFRDYHTAVFKDDSGNKKELKCNERYYVHFDLPVLRHSIICGPVNGRSFEI